MKTLPKHFPAFQDAAFFCVFPDGETFDSALNSRITVINEPIVTEVFANEDIGDFDEVYEHVKEEDTIEIEIDDVLSFLSARWEDFTEYVEQRKT